MDSEDYIPSKMTAAEFDALLIAAGDRLGSETEELKRRNAVLRQLLEEKRRFAVRLEQTLNELQAEQERIDEEVRRLLSPDEWKQITSSAVV